MPPEQDLVVPQEVLDFIEAHDSFLVLGHKEPDGDCIGSQLALGLALRRLNKTVHLVNVGPFDRQEIAEYEDQFSPRLSQNLDVPPEAAIILDCSSPDRLGEVAESLEGLPVAVVDHHASGSSFGDVRYIHPDIPAATVLVFFLLQRLGLEPTPREAQLLFMGLATDTGFFRFLSQTQPIAFAVAAKLTQYGASPRETDMVLSTGRSMSSRKLIARMLHRLEELSDGAILLTYQTLADERELGNRRDSDALYRLLLAVENVRCIAVVKEKPNGCAMSFRSLDDTDVGAFAVQFGGGGHQKASGAFVTEDLQTFLPRLRHALQQLF